MKKIAIFCLYFSLILPLFSMTLLVETLHPVEIELWEEEELSSIRAMENGLVDQCFDRGYMVFNSFLSASDMENKLIQSLDQAQQIGADYLLRIIADVEEEKIQFVLYSVLQKDMLLSEQWMLSEWDRPEGQTQAELFYMAGETCLEALSTQF